MIARRTIEEQAAYEQAAQEATRIESLDTLASIIAQGRRDARAARRLALAYRLPALDNADQVIERTTLHNVMACADSYARRMAD
jgi:hypothetical protein